jgi:subtilase family serine protease
MSVRKTISIACLAVAAGGALAGPAVAAPDLNRRIESAAGGVIITPGSSMPLPAYTGQAHTNFHIFVPAGQQPRDSGPGGKFETPASLACVYGVTAASPGCNPETLTAVANTGSRIVAIVDAYHDATAAHDLGVFSAQYGLPAITADNFAVVYATGTKPKQDPTGDWEVEESLDIEMAHALAPNAKIVLVEAASASSKALLAAELVASKLVAAAGGGEISNSWGTPESQHETADGRFFKQAGVVFFAASGDSPGVSFPSVLHDVVAVGGTSINRSPAGVFKSQTSWSTDGGGISAYVPTPSYQSGITGIVGTHRGVPDIAMIANPLTGVWVYDTTPYSGTVENWLIIGGTSVASPLAAALVNSAGSFQASSVAELTTIYAGLGDAANFTDITEGSCVNAPSGSVSKGYDLCTGVGALFGLAGK